MKTSARTKSGFASGMRRTAASPLPTATTSTPRSSNANKTIFWMLVLSSATRILGTCTTSRRTCTATRRPFSILYCSTPHKGRQRRRSTGVPQMLAGGKQGSYQGTSFRTPFFFLLEESLEAAVELLWAGAVLWPVVEELEESVED